MDTETYVKTAHPTGKDGDGERWAKSDVAGCRNLCDNGDVRTQKAIVHRDYQYVVRRITPVEGERLQGFADNWTRPCFTEETITDSVIDQFIDIHAKWQEINGKTDAKRKSRESVKKWLLEISSAECPDGPRYKCIGNSMSVNVMQWIGQRIEIADRIYKSTNK